LNEYLDLSGCEETLNDDNIMNKIKNVRFRVFSKIINNIGNIDFTKRFSNKNEILKNSIIGSHNDFVQDLYKILKYYKNYQIMDELKTLFYYSKFHSKVQKEYYLTQNKYMINLACTKVKVSEDSIFLYPIQELFSFEAISKLFNEIYGEEELMKYVLEMVNDEINYGKTNKRKFCFIFKLRIYD
jgi:hypothetical protein